MVTLNVRMDPAAEANAAAAAAAAAALADANLGDVIHLLEADADAVDINAALPAILGQLATLGHVRTGLDELSARLAAVELRAEGAALANAAGPAAGAAAPGAAAGAGSPPVVGAAPAAAGAGHQPAAGGATDLAAAIAQGLAQALRSQRGRANFSSDDDDDSVAPARAFTDGQAKRIAKGGDALTFFQLPPAARTSYPAPFRMKTLQYQGDFNDQSPGADEAKHLFIVGAWSTRIHNEVLSFLESPAHGDVRRLQAMLVRSRVFHHQLAELCAARYDVLREPDDAIAAQLQERLLSPPDVHASRARRGLQVETVNLRDRALNKAIAANEVKTAAGRRRGTRGGGRHKPNPST